MNNKIISSFALILSALSVPVLADTTEQRLADLEQQLAILKSSVDKPQATIKGSQFSFYGSLRPTIEYIDQAVENDGDSRLQTSDALSLWGVKGEYKINDDTRAFFKGEFKIDLANDADLGGARLVYTGLDTQYGQFTIGRQRPAQYTLIAEYVDIFNHKNSPFAYDYKGPFFVSNMMSYQKSLAGFTFLAGISADGGEGENNADFSNFGLAYNNQDLHLATTYLQRTQADGLQEGAENRIYAVSIANTFGSLYLAAAVNFITDESVDSIESDSTTVDLAAAYQLSQGYKIKAGYFSLTSDVKTEEVNGFNITLENQISDSVRVHLEYLNKNFEQSEDFQSIAFGLRYDFALSY